MTVLLMADRPAGLQKRFNAHRFCVAPMLDWTDRHCRYFFRLLSKQSFLYTEMVTTGAILNSDKKRYLDFSPAENPIALQLGGNNPKALAQCARLGESYGYNEINLNCGCPSNKVRAGHFGAALMKQPQLVHDCIAAMRDAVGIPITLKHRIGVDRDTNYQWLSEFIGKIAETGCRIFLIHARAAWLDGLSPKQNRCLPPLNYSVVYKLKQDFPNCEFVLNGGIDTLTTGQQHLTRLDGIMVGRAVYKNPYMLADVDQIIFYNPKKKIDRLSVLENLIPYAEHELSKGTHLHQITRHILGLFHGQPGAQKFRQLLSTRLTRSDNNPRILVEALALMADYSGRDHSGRDHSGRDSNNHESLASAGAI